MRTLLILALQQAGVASPNIKVSCLPFPSCPCRPPMIANWTIMLKLNVRHAPYPAQILQPAPLAFHFPAHLSEWHCAGRTSMSAFINSTQHKPFSQPLRHSTPQHHLL